MKKVIGKTFDNENIIAIDDIKNFGLVDETGEVVSYDGRMYQDTDIVYQESIVMHRDYTVVGYVDKSKYSVAGHAINEMSEMIDGYSYKDWSSYICDEDKYAEIHMIFGIDIEENPLELFDRWYYVEVNELYGLIIFDYVGDEPQVMMSEDSEIVRALLYGLSEYAVDSISFIDLGILDERMEVEKVKEISERKISNKEIAAAIGVSEVTMSRADKKRKDIYTDAYRWRLIK